MSQTSTGLTEERQPGAQGAMGAGYVPTEEERRVFEECNSESFMYRSVPFSVIGMGITQALVARGTLSPSPRFGSLPKVAFAAFCGYLIGKMSYMKTCQEKFKRLENSPLGQTLRMKSSLSSNSSRSNSELSDPDAQSFTPMFQPADSNSQTPSNTRDGFGYSTEPSMQMGRADDHNAQAPPVQSYVEDEEPRRRPILYEDLRTKNRENYEVTLTQKAEALLKTPADREADRSEPRKEDKKNIYGDSWDE